MHTHLHRNISQKRHEMFQKILDRFTSNIKQDSPSQEYFVNKCETTFKLKLSDLDEKLRKFLNEDKEINIKDFNNRRKFWIILYQLFKIQTFVKAQWGGRKLQAQEIYMILKHNLTSSKGWNTKTKKRWRKININDCAVICNCSSSTPIKINALLKTSNAVASNYKDINNLYQKFEDAGIKSTMFAWLLKSVAIKNDIEDNHSELDSLEWINDPPDDSKKKFGTPIIDVRSGKLF